MKLKNTELHFLNLLTKTSMVGKIRGLKINFVEMKFWRLFFDKIGLYIS